MTTLEQAKETAKILSEKKGLDIKVIEISDVSVIADYMVIATGNSSTHVKALADEVEEQGDGQVVGRQVDQHEEQPRQLDGDGQAHQHHAGKEFTEKPHGIGLLSGLLPLL